jgi:hypothetical protein
MTTRFALLLPVLEVTAKKVVVNITNSGYKKAVP